MPTDTLNLFEDFVDRLGNGDHDLGADTIELALSNDAPSSSADATRADLTSELATANGYTQGAHPFDNVTYTESSGTGTFDADPEVITASGGSIGPFQYVIIYNSSTADVVDGLIGWLDYGSALTVLDGETFTVTFTTNIFTIT